MIAQLMFPVPPAVAVVVASCTTALALWRSGAAAPGEAAPPALLLRGVDAALSRAHALAAGVLPGALGGATGRRALVALVATLLSLVALRVLYRAALRALFRYTAWLHEGRGAISAKTKAWMLLLRSELVVARSRRTFAYQDLLPTLPLPEVDATVRRYLLSMEPLLAPGTKHQ